MNPCRVCAAVFGFLAVALGAIGAHAFSATIEAHGRVETWKTAALYHVAHAVALLALSAFPCPPKWPARLFAAGIVVFSGSLYALALTDLRPLGAVTPIGGLLLLAGWLALLFPPHQR